MAGVAVSADRLRCAAAAWPPATARAARVYLRDLHGPVATARGDPFWLLLPAWLHETASARARRALRPGFLPDVAWGQYCLFLCIRIHDDLFDGQAGDRRLLFVADHLLIESERAFAPHVPRAFWPLYRDLVEATIGAILEMDERQRAGTAMRDGLAAHARVASIFKAGAAAVCLATRRSRLLPRVAAFADELAILSQALDDLRDLVEDSDRGRINSVAALAGGRAAKGDIGHAAAGLLIGDGGPRLVAALRRSHRRAREAIRSLDLAPAERYLDAVATNLDRLAASLHRARVEARFGRRS